VQPQLAWASLITKGFDPVFLKRNDTGILSPSTILPKSFVVSNQATVVKLAESDVTMAVAFDFGSLLMQPTNASAIKIEKNKYRIKFCLRCKNKQVVR
jgi:hypothetical protein